MSFLPRSIEFLPVKWQPKISKAFRRHSTPRLSSPARRYHHIEGCFITSVTVDPYGTKSTTPMLLLTTYTLGFCSFIPWSSDLLFITPLRQPNWHSNPFLAPLTHPQGC